MEQEEIVDALRDFLDNDDWHYEYDAENNKIRMSIALKSKLKSGNFIVDIKDDSYLVYLYSPIKGTTENLDELQKYLTMANYGLCNGNFELDLRDGEIRYKIYVNCRGLDALSKDIITSSIYLGCFMMDRYGDGIAAVALGFSDADTEIKKAEHQDDDDDDSSES